MNTAELVESDRELFASVVSVFPTLDPEKLIEGQKLKFRTYLKFLVDPNHSPLPRRETLQSASNFCIVVVDPHFNIFGN